jgi:hypothetical protein
MADALRRFRLRKDDTLIAAGGVCARLAAWQL